jgi:hypothetical protein
LKTRIPNIAVCMGALLAGCPLLAQANLYTFDFLSTDHTYEASGTLTTSNTLDAAGGYDITGISGSVTGAGGGTIDSLIANPDAPYPYVLPGQIIPGWSYEIDNVFFPSASPTLDVWGVVFTVGPNIWNLWGNPDGQYELHSFTALGGTTIGQLVDKLGSMVSADPPPANVPAVPEPETYALLAAGLGLMTLVSLRRKNPLQA